MSDPTWQEIIVREGQELPEAIWTPGNLLAGVVNNVRGLYVISRAEQGASIHVVSVHTLRSGETSTRTRGTEVLKATLDAMPKPYVVLQVPDLSAFSRAVEGAWYQRPESGEIVRVSGGRWVNAHAREIPLPLFPKLIVRWVPRANGA